MKKMNSTTNATDADVLDFVTIVSSSGTGLSILCVIVLLITWCLLPQWRSLQNYISLNQIIMGTLFQCLFEYYAFSDVPLSGTLFLSYYLLTTSICWSLCSTLVAYLRLVLIYAGKISYEKRKATVFTYGVAGIMLGICQGIIPKFVLNAYIFGLFPLIYVMFINFLIFIRIIKSVLSCGKKRMSKRTMSHVVSLIAVAFICDSMLIAVLFTFIFFSILSEFIFSTTVFLLTHRLVFQSIFVLLRRSTRMHWKQYLRERKRRNLNFHNTIEL